MRITPPQKYTHVRVVGSQSVNKTKRRRIDEIAPTYDGNEYYRIDELRLLPVLEVKGNDSAAYRYGSGSRDRQRQHQSRIMDDTRLFTAAIQPIMLPAQWRL